MDYFIIALIAIALGIGIGFVLGLQSKAMAKIKARKEVKKFDIQVNKDLYQRTINNLPDYQAPPPPPPSRVIKEGQAPPKPISKPKTNHVRPGIMYDKDTFVDTKKCSSCDSIGHHYDMSCYRPCPKCGGKVKNNGAAIWKNGQWCMSKANV